MADDQTIGKRLRALRGKRLQVDVAAAVEISRAHLAKIERGHDRPGGKLLRRLADYYGVPLDELDPPAEPLGTQLGKNAEDRAVEIGWNRILYESRAEDIIDVLERLRRIIARRAQRRGAGEDRRKHKPKRGA